MTTQHDMYSTHGLHRAVQQQPDGLATVFGGRRRTFAEQADRVARLAAALRELGVRDGTPVGTLGHNSDRYAEALLVIPWADGIFNVIDSMRAPFEVASMLAESETEILFVDDAFSPYVAEIREAWPGLRTVIQMGESRADPAGEMLDYEQLIAANRPVRDARRGGDSLAGLLHTGGTTNLPKAVMHTHRSMLHLLMTIAIGAPGFVRPGTRHLQITPMSHMSGVGGVVLQSLFGNTFVPVPRFDPGAVLETIEVEQITGMFIVPPMLQAVVGHPDAERRDLSSVRMVFYGASPMTESLLQRVQHRIPHTELAQMYAMTEAACFTVLAPEDHHPGPHLRSAGRAAVHTELRVVDAEDADVPTNTPGEILLSGPGLMRGYWNDPDATAEVLRGGWMHTGDVGYLDEAGYLYVVDRLKDVIVVGGDNVHSAEVENALSSHPDVAACAVIAVPDGETGERVHAAVVLRPGAGPDADQLRKHCASLVSEFKVPRSWEFVDVLPTSPTGKVLKRELRKPYWGDRERQIN